MGIDDARLGPAAARIRLRVVEHPLDEATVEALVGEVQEEPLATRDAVGQEDSHQDRALDQGSAGRHVTDPDGIDTCLDHAIITGKDVKFPRVGGVLKDETMLASEKVRYVGEPVAAKPDASLPSP